MAGNRREPSLAVLIDAENMNADHAAAIFEEIAKLGVATVRRIYGNFSGNRLKSWRKVMSSFAIEQRHVRSYFIHSGYA